MSAPTEANFRTAISECHDAVASQDWTTARRKYVEAVVLHAGMAKREEHQSAVVERQESLAAIKEAIDAVDASDSRVSDKRRIGWARTRFQH